MKRLIALLLLTTASLFSLDDPNALTNFEGEPCAFVEGVVNVISGDFTEVTTDLVIPGAEPLSLKRFYSSASKCNGPHRPCALGAAWALNHGAAMESEVNKLGTGIRTLTLRDANGVVSCFEGKEEYRNPLVVLQYHPEVSFKGMTNCAQGSISGRTNLKNTRILYGLPSTEEDDVRLYTRVSLGSGKTREFVDNKEKKTVYPNGNQILYEYDGENVKKVKTVDSQGKKIGSLLYSKLVDEGKKTRLTITSSDNRTVEYHFKKIKFLEYLEEVIPVEAPPQKYKWEKTETGAVIVRKECPDGRFMDIDYYDDTKARGRVKRLYGPVGTDDSPVVTYRFSYALKYEKKNFEEVYEGGVTTVQDANDNCTQYAFNNENRLTEICRCEGEKKVLVKEKFFWGLKGTSDYTNLLSRAVLDAKGNIVQCRALNYDAQGNVVKERLAGNITGKNLVSPLLNEVGRLQSNGCDCYQKEYTYSEDGYNLMLSETDGRKKITYTYYPKRELMESKLVWDQGKIAIRSFFGYDSSGSLIYEIHDDGSSPNKEDLTGVTERRIKRIKVRTERAPIGFPAEIEEKYLDLSSGNEKLLHRVINDYSPYGKLIAQDHYDSESLYLYTLRWEYDAYGNVIVETDALGHTIKRKYDANNLLVFEQGPRTDSYKEFFYDYSNRLIRAEEVLADGLRLIQHFKYNYLNQKIAATDIYGNETTYSYDALGRMVETRLPDTSTISTTYNVLGHVAERTDAYKKKIEYKHTILGKPYHVIYPDSSEEKCEYSLDGLLVRSVARDGVVTLCDYDYQGRLVKQEWYGLSGKLLKRETKNYNAFHLLSETDGNGNTTCYHYDYAGRLIRRSNSLSSVAMEYDSCNRLAKETRTDDKNGEKVVKCFKYDLVNRLVEEYLEEGTTGKGSRKEYAYDECGNRCLEIGYNAAGKAVTTTDYDSRGNPIKITDPEGNVVKVRYEYKCVNDQRQHVAFKETIDPMGNKTSELCDVMGRLANIKKRDSKGKLIYQCDILYDLNGKKDKECQTVITPNAPDRKVLTGWSYDPCGRVTSIIDACGDAEQKTTRFTYNSRGQKETICKPNGVVLSHEYDEKGRLHDFKSSENTIHYNYWYDANDNCIRVDNLLDKSFTTRQFDAQNILIGETLGNGLALQFDVNGLERLNKLILPDGSGIGYTYEGTLLKDVQRLSAKNELLYAHEYVHYDQAGNLLEAKMIGNAGQLTFAYDLHGRTNQIKHAAWSQEIPKEGRDKVGNILVSTMEDRDGRVSSKYNYDALYHLTKEAGAFDHSYSFDSISNRVQKDDQKCKINALNQLTRQGDSTCKYDGNGNPIEMVIDGVVYKLAYDGLDRLIAVTKNNQTTKYTYDSFDRRLTKNDVRYLYFQQCEIGACDNEGKIQELRLLGIGKGAEIGAAIAIEAAGAVYAPIHNVHGSVAALVNMDGTLAESYSYTAFGEESIETAISPWRFSSKRVDEETGFVYFGRRYYEPRLARWLTKDPKGYDAGPNLYAYVSGNPLLRFDLWGLEDLQWTREGDTWMRGRPDYDRAPGNDVMRPRQSDPARERHMSMPRNPNFPEHRVRIKVIGENKSSRVQGVVTNGICASVDETIAFAEEVYARTNVPIHVVGIESYGFALDIMCHFLAALGLPLAEVIALQELKEMIFRDANGNVISVDFAHSNGGTVENTTLGRVSKNIAKQTVVVTAGTASVIQDYKCKEATHYVNKCDYVTALGDPIGYIGAKTGFSKEIIIRKSDQPTFLSRHAHETGYDYAGEHYINKINDIKKAYGIP